MPLSPPRCTTPTSFSPFNKSSHTCQVFKGSIPAVLTDGTRHDISSKTPHKLYSFMLSHATVYRNDTYRETSPPPPPLGAKNWAKGEILLLLPRGTYQHSTVSMPYKQPMGCKSREEKQLRQCCRGFDRSLARLLLSKYK